MTVRYQTRFPDFLAFHVYHFTRSPFTIGFLLVILLASSVLVWSNSKEEDNLYFKIAVLIITEILILGFMLGFYFVIVVVSFISPKNKAMFAKTTLSLGEDSFVDESPYNRNEYKWPSVQKLAPYLGPHFSLPGPVCGHRNSAKGVCGRSRLA